MFNLDELLNTISGALLVVTFTDILPLPTLPYWSANVIFEVIVSPLVSLLPLMLLPTDKLPLELTAINAFDEVNSEQVCEPWFGE